jgi:branched-chain amino acid transport system ATP-binding protein
MSDVALSINNVRLAFGGVNALDGVNYDVPTGQIVGIIGPNGAGKTTLFDTISGFRTPNSGSIILHTADGPVDLVKQPAYRRNALGIGRTFQNARLFRSLSLRDILRTVQHDSMKQSGLFRSIIGTRGARLDEATVAKNADEALELVGLHKHADKPAQELSTGMLRLCELAAVIAVKPKVLLLDEPSSGIAQAETEALAPLLKRVRDHLGATMLLIEHDMPMIMKLSDTIVAMAAGQVVTHGKPKDVRNHPEVLTSYLGQSA